MSKEERVELILRTARFSKYLKQQGIHAAFNLEMCDFNEVAAEVDLSETCCEIAEFGQAKDGTIMEDGKPVMGGPIFPLDNNRSEKSDYFNENQTILDMFTDVSLDDCFTVNRDGSYDEHRSFERVLTLVKAQGSKPGRPKP